jgi:hypothetical protein
LHDAKNPLGNVFDEGIGIFSVTLACQMRDNQFAFAVNRQIGVKIAIMPSSA